MRLLAINSPTEDGDILCSTLEDFNAASCTGCTSEYWIKERYITRVVLTPWLPCQTRQGFAIPDA